MQTLSILRNTYTVRCSGDNTWPGNSWRVQELTSSSAQGRPSRGSDDSGLTQATRFAPAYVDCCYCQSLCFQRCCREERARTHATGHKGLLRRREYELLLHLLQRVGHIVLLSFVRLRNAVQAPCTIVPHSLQELPAAAEVLVAQLPCRPTAKLLASGEELGAARSAIKELMQN